MNKIEHIGIAVSNLQEAIKTYNQILDTECVKIEEVAGEHVKVAFFEVGESKIELLEPQNGQGAIATYLERKGQGIHHLAFEVADIEQEIKRLKGLGYQILDGYPKAGADNKLVAFLHPKETSGVLIEICQDC